MINIILYQPEIPPNTGNIIRTCHATNAILHIIKPLAFDLYHPLIKRAAAGREITDIEHYIYDDYEEFELKNGNKKIYYITRYGMKNYVEPNYTNDEDIWIMFGRESTGIPKEILSNNIDTCLRIPMTDKCRSLNLANSVSLVTYEILRQNNFKDLSLFESQKGRNYLLEDYDE
ncbi:MAG: tRNA (cytidine(34)-2'-O)-methyltransferase [Mycoplasmataceae bacterium]|nr:tRNA (cytidine(34)-2'-O)-methyltransferase [Mycoplasmataceae bacterium]